MRHVLRCFLAAGLSLAAARAQDGAGLPEGVRYAPTRSADGFDMPVAPPDAAGFYRSRGLILGRHCGDDWNSNAGGNTDLGANVYAAAHGLVVYARDAHMGWGNTVIIRHVYWEGGKWNYADSFYTHMQRICVREGQQARRGQLVGAIGTNRGMYVAHLHFEIRRNLRVGINQSSYRKDLSNYYRPYDFIMARRQISGGNRRVDVPTDTFRLQAQPVDTMSSKPKPAAEPSGGRGEFRVNRYSEPR